MISNGVFLMDTRSGESKRLLVRLALRRGGDRSCLLMGGLGVGFSLEALRSDYDGRQIEPKIVKWNHLPRALLVGR
jgi:hypothetical protein